MYVQFRNKAKAVHIGL